MTDVSMKTAEGLHTAPRGRPWFSICCIGCIVLLVGFFVASYAFVRVISGPTSRTVRSLPANYPADLPLFRIQDASSIVHAQGKDRGNMMRIIAVPMKFFAQFSQSTSSQGQGTSDRFAQVWSGYTDQVQGMDVVTVTWEDLNASREDVLRYYADLFQRVRMENQAMRDEATGTDIVLATRPSSAIQLRLRDVPETPEIDELVITVDYVNTQ